MSNKKQPRVTVLLPVYNAGSYLATAIESILNQTFTDFELLIINDGSTDESAKTIANYRDERITVINRPNKGFVPTLNEGVAKAKADLVARMDQDDFSLPERLSKQVTYMEEHPQLLVLGAGAQIMDTNDNIVGVRPLIHGSYLLPRAMAVTNPFNHGSVLYRKSAVLDAGGYREEMCLAEDYDLWVRLARKGDVDNYPEYLYRWRRNPTGMSLTRSDEQLRLTKKIVGEVWKSFGDAGPASKQAWSKMWPDKSVYAHQAQLHYWFGRGYVRRGKLWTGLSNLLAAVRYSGVSHE